MSYEGNFRDLFTSDSDRAVHRAREEWQEAENFFNNAPSEMAEYAVLRLATAAKRYEYLLKKRKLMD